MLSFAARRRRERMQLFIAAMDLQGGERIIDLGGRGSFWASCPIPLEITVVNLPGIAPPDEAPDQHRVHMIEGDACDLSEIGDMSFDIAFSNSVIEHVGGPDKQAAFAGEALRLAPRIWVQTPSKWFPMEAHTMMPFWWFYPEALRQRIIAGWRRKRPGWTEMIEGTTVLEKGALQRMFPGTHIAVERFLGIPKSYIVQRLER